VTSAMISLMSAPSDHILASRLHELLNTCLPGASLLTEEQRNNRLRVCLKSLWYCLRAFNLPENMAEPLVPYVRAIFASPPVIRRFQTETDFAVRLLGRCFGSLVVKKLANDIHSRHILTGDPPTTAEMPCLSSILGTTGEQVWSWLDHKGAIDLANVTVLASGGLDTLIDSGTGGVPADVMDVFQQTLDILAKGMFPSQPDVEWDPDQVENFHQIYSRTASAPVPDVLRERLQYVSERLPPARRPPYMREPEMEMPFPELGSETAPSPGTSQLRVGPVRVDGVPDSGYAEGAILTPISAVLSHGHETSNFV